ncbi:MAG: type II toxin-antitoxin system RelE/ParE family toxin [Clostridia bacterium]|jgi:phage-related protein|nr:type II toxin-antitoxin system RelE/ParE family toxin [Clostridia bacterium]
MSPRKKLRFEYYETHNECEFINFLHTLPILDQAKILATIQNIEEQGILVASRMQWVKKIEKDFYEIRVKRGSNIQRVIYFHIFGNRYLITHGFTKKSTKTPIKEIVRAKAIREKYEKCLREKENKS